MNQLLTPTRIRHSDECESLRGQTCNCDRDALFAELMAKREDSGASREQEITLTVAIERVRTAVQFARQRRYLAVPLDLADVGAIMCAIDPIYRAPCDHCGWPCGEHPIKNVCGDFVPAQTVRVERPPT